MREDLARRGQEVPLDGRGADVENPLWLKEEH